jgi:hypothetical protein
VHHDGNRDVDHGGTARKDRAACLEAPALIESIVLRDGGTRHTETLRALVSGGDPGEGWGETVDHIPRLTMTALPRIFSGELRSFSKLIASHCFYLVIYQKSWHRYGVMTKGTHFNKMPS